MVDWTQYEQDLETLAYAQLRVEAAQKKAIEALTAAGWTVEEDDENTNAEKRYGVNNPNDEGQEYLWVWANELPFVAALLQKTKGTDWRATVADDGYVELDSEDDQRTFQGGDGQIKAALAWCEANVRRYCPDCGLVWPSSGNCECCCKECGSPPNENCGHR